MGTAVLSPQDCLPSPSSQNQRFSAAIPSTNSLPAVATAKLHQQHLLLHHHHHHHRRRRHRQMLAYPLPGSATDSSNDLRGLASSNTGFHGGLLPLPDNRLLSSVHSQHSVFANAQLPQCAEIPSPRSLQHSSYQRCPLQASFLSPAPPLSSIPSSDLIFPGNIHRNSCRSSVIRSIHVSLPQKSAYPKSQVKSSHSHACKNKMRNQSFHPRKRTHYIDVETEKGNSNPSKRESMHSEYDCTEVYRKTEPDHNRRSKENTHSNRRIKTSNHVNDRELSSGCNPSQSLEDVKEISCDEDALSEKSSSSEERWAGPSFFNSPPPSSLPFPTFSIIKTSTVSCDDQYFRESLEHKHTLPSPEVTLSGNVPDAVSATKILRKLLNMDPLSS